LIGRFGWRTSYALLGLAVAVVMLPVGLLLFRRQPEDYGLLPDGAGRHDQTDTPERTEESLDENWTSSEAIRTPAFWIINLGLASISMLGTGLQFHMVSVFADAGLSSDVAAAVFMPISATNAIVALTTGVLVDRVPARYLLFAALLGQASSLVMAPHLQGIPSALGYGAVLGFTSGLQMTVGSVVWAKYFGRRHLGSITGLASLITIGGSALGPMPMGIARDLLGSYTLALTIAAALPLVLGFVALFARQPQKSRSA
jgi:sugar phosphate permease